MTPNGRPEVGVRFEGFGVGDEIIGGIEANFLVVLPGEHAREVAVAVNDPALDFLVEMLGQEKTETARHEAAQLVGQLWIESLAHGGKRIDPVIFLSRSRMEMTPGFLDEVRQRCTTAERAIPAAPEASSAH